MREIRAAVARGATTRDGLAVAEGFHLLEEATRSWVAVSAVVAAESAMARIGPCAGKLACRVVQVPDKIFAGIASTETSQGVIALVKPPEWTFGQLSGASALVVLLDGIQDPGNAGAIVRSAEAFGATGVVFLKGTANPWNPKTLRASAGSLFRMPMLSGIECGAALAALKEAKVRVYGAVPAGPKSVAAPEAEFSRSCAIAIGSEGRGLSTGMLAAAIRVAIPTQVVESLNAATAAAVLLYEASRQRAGGTEPGDSNGSF